MKICPLIPRSLMIFLSLAGLLFALTGWAQQGQTETPAPGQTVKNSQAGTEQAQKTTAESEPQSPSPVSRFTPSEKIHADDAVSFPVDI